MVKLENMKKKKYKKKEKNDNTLAICIFCITTQYQQKIKTRLERKK